MKLFKGTLIAVAVALMTAAPAFATVTIPSTGVDVEDWITAAITALGAVIAVAVGGYFAFLLVRKGIRWAGGMLK